MVTPASQLGVSWMSTPSAPPAALRSMREAPLLALPSMLPAPPKPCAQAVTRRAVLSQKSLEQSSAKANAVRVPPPVVVLRACAVGGALAADAWLLAREVAVWPNTVPRNWLNTPNEAFCGAVAPSPVSCASVFGDVDTSRLP